MTTDDNLQALRDLLAQPTATAARRSYDPRKPGLRAVRKADTTTSGDDRPSNLPGRSS